MRFETSQEVRKFLKAEFPKIKVRWANNPFGGEGRFWVSLTDIPTGVTLIHSSGSNTPTQTFASDTGVASRIARLRERLQGSNASVSH
jgi:hypothetical protein